MRLRGSPACDRGFTLVELMVVVTIIGFLAAIALASYMTSVRSTQRAVCFDNQRKFDSVLNMYSLEHNGSVPASLEEMSDYLIRYQVARDCPADGRDLEYDPVATQVTCTFPGHQP